MRSVSFLALIGARWRPLVVLLVGMVVLTACGDSAATTDSAVASTPTTAAVTILVTTTESVSYEDGQPGSCRVLDERYCSLGELVLWENGYLFVGFTLPPGTSLFAFGGGEMFEIWLSPEVGSYRPENSYPAVHVSLSEPERATRDVVVVFMDRPGDRQGPLKTVEEGEVIGYLTAETLPVLPQGIQEGSYSLLVFLGDFDVADAVAYQEYFGLTVEP